MGYSYYDVVALCPSSEALLVTTLVMATLTLSSDAFEPDDMIPARFTCEGENINPPLTITDTPDGTMSLALVVEDPDLPGQVKKQLGIEIFDHWVAYNIPPSTTDIPADEPIGTQGQNSGEEVGYTGPCPPAGHTPTKHRYIFTVYAIDTTLNLEEGATKEELMSAIRGHTVASAELVGYYEMQ